MLLLCSLSNCLSQIHHGEMLPGLCLAEYWANWELCSAAAWAAWCLSSTGTTITPSHHHHHPGHYWTLVFLRALNTNQLILSQQLLSQPVPSPYSFSHRDFVQLRLSRMSWWVLVWSQHCWPMARQPQVNDPTNQMLVPHPHWWSFPGRNTKLPTIIPCHDTFNLGRH